MPIRPENKKPEYPCTDCGGDAYIGYAAGKEKNSDWNGLLKKVERLCTGCFKKRGGKKFF